MGGGGGGGYILMGPWQSCYLVYPLQSVRLHGRGMGFTDSYCSLLGGYF